MATATAKATRSTTQSLHVHEDDRSSAEESDFDGFDSPEDEDDFEDEALEKDEEEKELERLVFGTSDDYRQGLSKLAVSAKTGGWSANVDVTLEDGDDEDTGLEKLEDSKVLWLLV
jgi:hypothetical protein